MDVNRNAQIVVELSTVIDAPLDTVWQLHTTIDAWPSWQADITAARIDGPVTAGTSFTWHTHGMQITSTVGEVDPAARIVWGGAAHGIDGVHAWTFEPVAHGVLVTTTESWDGPPITANPIAMRAALTTSLTTWLAALKTTAEHPN